MNRIAQDILMHIGMPRRSGRYEWGSGENPYQRTSDFVNRVRDLRKNKMSDVDIAKTVGLTNSSDLRNRYTEAIEMLKGLKIERALSLKEEGKNTTQIGRIMGIGEGTVRSILKTSSIERTNKAKVVTDFIREKIDEKGLIDVGEAVNTELGISKEKMKQVISNLVDEGYLLKGRTIPQATNPGRNTILKVLCRPGSPKDILYTDLDKIGTLTDYKVRKDESGKDVVDKGFEYPESLSSKRLKINYAEEGGKEKDGLIEIRRGVEDISLGDSRYAQVRILVDGTHYIKGMAIHSDDLPEGVDVLFNTNKAQGTPVVKVLKKIQPDKDNPFGSTIKPEGGQRHYIDEDGNRKLSVINKKSDEGDWEDWKDTLPSQFLVKQPLKLINRQLGLSIEDKQAEFDDIMALTNPTVKKKLLESFADDCDSAAVHLKAAALPRQKYQVLFPINTLKDNEAYNTNFDDGETVALVRFPHGGTFEIPIVTINNKNQEGIKYLGKDAKDAVGVNHVVAKQLSGADNDGDTLMMIPCNSEKSGIKISARRTLDGLKTFDAEMEYGCDKVVTDSEGKEHYYRGGKEFKRMMNTQNEMGRITNLITDMQIKGASDDEVTRAIKHSMVVIDANKHFYDYKHSEEINGIKALKKKWQGRVNDKGNDSQGASTLLSRAKQEQSIDKRVGSPKVNQKGKPWYQSDLPEGELIWKSVTEPKEKFKKLTDKNGKSVINPETGKPIYVRTGKFSIPTQKSTQMAETKDAHTLSSGTVQEDAYANYANKMKAFANKARKEMVYTDEIEYKASAKEVYKQEHASLLAQLNMAKRNKPRERQAQIYAAYIRKAKKDENPDLTKAELKKISQQALEKGRRMYGAERTKIKINDREWEAIQSGAVSPTFLKDIMDNTDVDIIREYATPKSRKAISSGQEARIKTLSNSGLSFAQIARAVNLSPSTVSNFLKEN